MKRPTREQIEQELIDSNQMYYGSTIEDKYHQRLEEYINYLESESQKSAIPNVTQWVAVKMGELPFGEVLGLTSSGDRLIVDYYNGGWRIKGKTPEWEKVGDKMKLKTLAFEDITHWTELPKPPCG